MQYALLFDLDGTLIDSIGLLLRCVDHAFSDRERRPSHSEWIAGIGTPLRSQLSQWANDEADVEALVRKFRDFQNVHLESLTTAFPGINDMLEELHGEGFRIGLVTSKGKEMTRRSIRHVGIERFFHTVVTVEETVRHKPDPAPVQYALRELNVVPDNALFAGDSPHDIRAGNAAGVTTVACRWGPFSADELAAAAPDYTAADVAELREIIASVAGVPTESVRRDIRSR